MWQVHLWEVWRIFDGNAVGMVIRQAMKIQPFMLYSKDKGVGTYEKQVWKILFEHCPKATNIPHVLNPSGY